MPGRPLPVLDRYPSLRVPWLWSEDAADAAGQDAGVHTYDASNAAIRPLMSAYWSSKGWRTPPVMPAAEEFERAVKGRGHVS